ncbi:MAG: DUF2007 domain-containing protein [Ilumatobacteraceae bacterium]|nr:DUF2007 domain-containing protein [Ilumatobacteraceae bacterium]
MGAMRDAWQWVFGKHLPKPPDPERTVEAAWVPQWQAPMIVDTLVAAGVPAVTSDDFGIHLLTDHRGPMARIFVTEDRQAEAQTIIEEILGHPPTTRRI